MGVQDQLGAGAVRSSPSPSRPIRSRGHGAAPAQVGQDGSVTRRGELAAVPSPEGGRARLKPVPERDRRKVALPPWLVEMLVAHRQWAAAGRGGGRLSPEGDDLVFCAPDGGWLTPERFTRVMDKLIEQSHVPRITPNELQRVAHPRLSLAGGDAPLP